MASFAATAKPGSIRLPIRGSKEDGQRRKASWESTVDALKVKLKDASPVSAVKASGQHTFQSLELAIINTTLDEGAPWKLNAENDISPFLRILDRITSMFLKSMAPSKTALFFLLGTLECTIDTTQQLHRNWVTFVGMLSEAQQKLEKLEGATKWLGKDFEDSEGADGSEEQNKLGDTILAILQTLLDLWIDVLAAVRESPLVSFEDELEPKRQREMSKISEIVLHFFHEMVINQAELRDRAQAPAQRTAASTTTTTENDVKFPLKVLPWPAYNGFFGREGFLSTLATHLGLHNYADRGSGDVRSCLLWGEGGVGKTQIARAFAHRNEAGFDAIFWVRSDTEVNIMADFTEIALRLNLPGASRESQTGSWFILTKWLQEQQSSPKGKRWLIIYDNCEFIKDINPKYIPTTKGSVLITSRNIPTRLDDSKIRQVNPFDWLNGLKFMKKLLYHDKGGRNKVLSTSEHKALRDLLKKVSRLPLGIHVMVALMLPRMGAKQQHPIRNFSKYYNKHPKPLLIRSPLSAYYNRDDLDKVWSLSFTSLDSKALSVLGILSFFAPNDISMSWFDLGSKEIVTTHKILSVCKSVFEIECAIIELQGAALISKNDDDGITDSDSADTSSTTAIMTPDTDDSHAYSDLRTDSEGDSKKQSQPDSGIKSAKVSLHRLVQEAVIYSRTPSDRQAIFDAAVIVMYEAFPKQDGGMALEGQIETCSRLTPHILALVQWHQEFGLGTQNPLLPSEELIHLLKSCIWYLYETGNDATALTLLDFAYQVIDRVGIMDKNPEIYADLAYKAGSVYMDWGFLSLCREIWTQARTILEDKRAA